MSEICLIEIVNDKGLSFEESNRFAALLVKRALNGNYGININENLSIGSTIIDSYISYTISDSFLYSQADFMDFIPLYMEIDDNLIKEKISNILYPLFDQILLLNEKNMIYNIYIADSDCYSDNEWNTIQTSHASVIEDIDNFFFGIIKNHQYGYGVKFIITE